MEKTMEKENRLGFLDGTMLKLIAMVSMVFDHVGDAFFPEATWMRIVGRIAMPVFAFCVAEGLSHTSDKYRYLARLCVFALVSEVPFDLFAFGKVLEFTHQNIMFTFALAVAALLVYDMFAQKGRDMEIAMLLMLIATMLLSIIIHLDYSFLGLGLVYIFYLRRNDRSIFRILWAALMHFLSRNKGVYRFGLLGFIPLLFYNGRKGAGLKWLFYVFYPAHLLLIYAVKMFVR